MEYYLDDKCCRHCEKVILARVGRGLCRRCWDDKKVRAKYPILAPFGGRNEIAIKLAKQRAARIKRKEWAP